MRLTLHSFKPNVPKDKICQLGVEYQVFEYNVGTDEAATFFDKLIEPRDSFYLEGSASYSLDFWKEEDQSIWVEITEIKFWAYSEVSLSSAKEIIAMLNREENFGNNVPMADQEWDAYSFIEKNGQ